jgi:hypothetical protein
VTAAPGVGGAPTGNDNGMELTLALTLPRDEVTVPVARHIVRNALEEVGVAADSVHAVVVAMSEACTNVLLHSGPATSTTSVWSWTSGAAASGWSTSATGSTRAGSRRAARAPRPSGDAA